MGLVNAISSSGVGAIDIFTADKGNKQKETVKEMFSQLVKDKREECSARIQNGSSGQSIQIGSGSYTETEWRKLIKGFDAAEAKLRESVNGTKKEVQETNNIEITDENNETKEKNVEMLLAEFTTATYPSGDKDIPDDVYYTFYTSDGIYCRKQGQSELEWQIQYEDKSEHEKVMSYLRSLDSQNNLRFACHENFWQDFLSGQVDMNKFNEFLETRVVDGVPNYLNVYETGTNIDIESAQYSKYMNLPDFVKNMCYTSEEAFETFFRHRKVDENKQPTHAVIDMNHLGQYYTKHPNEIGKRNHYYNGRWYSIVELAAIWNKELAELFEQSSQEM